MPTPAAILALAGGTERRNKQSHRPPKVEPTPGPVESLEPPAGLSAVAAEVWQDLAPKLAAIKLLTEVDARELARACELEACWRAALARAHEAKGKSWPSAMRLALDAAMKSSAAWQKFGVTPMARAKLGTPAPRKTEREGLAALRDKHRAS